MTALIAPPARVTPAYPSVASTVCRDLGGHAERRNRPDDEQARNPAELSGPTVRQSGVDVVAIATKIVA